MNQPLLVLVLTTVVTAIFHTLIPDHWLPFVLVARSRGWSARRTALLTAGSAFLHVNVSIGLAVATYLLGRGAGEVAGLGESLEQVSAALLMLFGLTYALWFLLRGGHQHFFGMHPHHEPEAPHLPEIAHPHDHAAGAAAGGEGAHVHDERRGRRAYGGIALAVIVGFNPCVLVIPYIYLAGTMGTGALVLVASAFALTTGSCLVGVTLLGLKGTARFESPFLMRYGEFVSGCLIALTGLVVMLVGH